MTHKLALAEEKHAKKVKAQFPLPEFTGRLDGPRTRVHFLTPKLTGVKKCTRELGPSTWVVETGLKSVSAESHLTHNRSFRELVFPGI